MTRTDGTADRQTDGEAVASPASPPSGVGGGVSRLRSAPAGTVPTQARSVRSREQILDATIECLLEHGYAATTTQRVQKRAGVSRGRLLHHFPSKRELIAGAMARAADKRLDGVITAQGHDDDGGGAAAGVAGAVAGDIEGAAAADDAAQFSREAVEQRVGATVAHLWQSHQEPIFWVAVESWNAARTDEELAAMTREHERSVMKRVRETTRGSLGPRLAAVPGTDAMIDIVFSSMRGIAMTYMFSGRSMDTEPMLDSWTRLLTDHFTRYFQFPST